MRRELRAVLNEWDPVGVYWFTGDDRYDPPPDDEYECLEESLPALLADGWAAVDLARFLRAQLLHHFGFPPEQVERYQPDTFAEHLKEWWAVSSSAPDDDEEPIDDFANRAEAEAFFLAQNGPEWADGYEVVFFVPRHSPPSRRPPLTRVPHLSRPDKESAASTPDGETDQPGRLPQGQSVPLPGHRTEPMTKEEIEGHTQSSGSSIHGRAPVWEDMTEDEIEDLGTEVLIREFLATSERSDQGRTRAEVAAELGLNSKRVPEAKPDH